MSLNRTLEIFFCCAFPLLFIPGYLYTHAFSWQNGFYGMVKDVVVAGHFPASSTTQRHASNITTELHMSLKGQALQSGFTGLKLLDDPLRFLVVALSSVYDGGMPALSLFGMHYIISFAGVCIIVHLEAMRLGNKAVALLRMPSLLVLLFEVLGSGVLGPIWMAFHVVFSSTRISPTKDRVSGELHHLQALPFSIIVGYLIPIMLPLLPENLPIPVLSTVQSRIAVAVGFPAYICIIQMSLASIFKRRNGHSNEPSKSSVLETMHNRSSLRRTYLLAFLCNAIPHVIYLALLILPHAVPTMFNPSIGSSLGKLPFCESPTSAGTKASSIHEGLYWYLEWQYAFGMSAFLLWGLACYASAKGKLEAQSTCRRSWLGVALRVFLVTSAFGGGAPAIMLFWERDEALIDAYLCEQSMKGEKKQTLQGAPAMRGTSERKFVQAT